MEEVGPKGWGGPGGFGKVSPNGVGLSSRAGWWRRTVTIGMRGFEQESV